MARKWKYCFLVFISLVFIGVTIVLPKIPQDPSYHRSENIWLNFLSNIPLAILAFWGIAFLIKKKKSSTFSRGEAFLYFLFFLGVFFTSIMSFYYHSQPDNERLIWDRIAMIPIYTSFLCVVIAERINLKFALILIFPFLLIGFGTVFYWYITELEGVGDLRFYGFIQFYPFIMTILIALLFKTPSHLNFDLAWVLILYSLAKVAEYYDRQLLQFTHFLSGYAIKHFLAAVAVFFVLRMLKKRMFKLNL